MNIGRRRKKQVYTTIMRADERYVSEQPGITSRHCFSAGAHYDPDNVAFGALVGIDEHTLAPGAAFDRHAHRAVTIVTWVLEGALRHEDSTGAVHLIEPGSVAVQVAGRGVEHTESNASDTEPVRFIQTTLVSEADEPSYRVTALPLLVENTLFDVQRDGRLILEAQRMHLFAAEGNFAVENEALFEGDSMRGTEEPITVEGKGELLVLLLR